MKEMIKRVREDRGGFTLAELLIVVAIVLVLVAIAVPVFSGAMTQAQDAVNKANERSIVSQASAAYMLATDDTGRKAALEGGYSISEDGEVSHPAEKDDPYKYAVAWDKDKIVVTIEAQPGGVNNGGGQG